MYAQVIADANDANESTIHGCRPRSIDRGSLSVGMAGTVWSW